jgi:hypothetical protein
MLVSGLLCLIVAGCGPIHPGDTARRASSDTIAVDTAAQAPPITFPVPGASALSADTLRARRKAVQVSEWYSRRLTIHRYVSYAVIPVFAVQYAAGDQLYKKSREAPAWARTTHRAGAATLAGMFTVNTVTGMWNLWDSRSVAQGRALRTVHALSMLVSDAGFTYAGVKLSEEAETSGDKRRLHRTIALSSMGVSVASALMMKLWNR